MSRRNNDGFACSLLKGAPGSDLFPGLLALLAPECGWEVWGLVEGWVVPNTFFTGLFLVAPASTIRLGISIT